VAIKLITGNQRALSAAFYSESQRITFGSIDVWRVFLAGRVKQFTNYSPTRTFSAEQPFFTDNLGSLYSCTSEAPLALSMSVTSVVTQHTVDYFWGTSDFSSMTTMSETLN
jgi:hypothetical protein